MPNGQDHKEYGGHKYADHKGTSDCQHGCGCWMGPARSGGPTGLDPFGACPGNPADGKLLGGNTDYDHVVTERIKNLESRAYTAELALEKVKPSKAKLADELDSMRIELVQKNNILDALRRILSTEAPPV